MKNPRTWRIKNPVYGYTLHLRHGGPLADANQWARRVLRGGDFGDGVAFGRVYVDDARPDHLLWLAESAGTATVAHESLHSVTHIATLMGFPSLSSDTDEPYCYLLAWTVGEICNRVWK